TLSFSLDPGAPVGATIHPTSGFFSWTPPASQLAGQTTVTVRVTDSGSPPLSAAQVVSLAVLEGFTTNLTLIRTGAVWRYRDTGENLGTAWSALTYDDN